MKLALSLALLAAPFVSAQVPDDSHFQVDTLVEGLVDAMEITVLPTEDVFIVERTGALKWYSPKSGETKVVKQFDVSIKTGEKSRETGLLGITADPNFMKNGWIYVIYSPPSPEEHRLSRFTFKKGTLSNEKILLHIPQSREDGVCHEGGSLAFDAKGNLFLSLGDNTNPFKSMYFAAQSMAAELSTGALAMLAVDLAPQSVALLITGLETTFGKKATGVVTFTCEDGEKIFAAVRETQETGEAATTQATTCGQRLR